MLVVYINIIIIIRRYIIIVTSYGLYKHDLTLSFPFPFVLVRVLRYSCISLFLPHDMMTRRRAARRRQPEQQGPHLVHHLSLSIQYAFISLFYSIRYRSSSSLRIAGCCTTARRYSTLLLGPVFEAIRGGGEQQRRVDPGRDRACLLCVYLHFTLLRTMCSRFLATYCKPEVFNTNQFPY